MNTLLKYTAYLFAGLIALLVVLVLILKLIPDTQYKGWITSAAQSATGRNFSIEALELDFGTDFRVRADNVRMANADWSKQDDMLKITRLEADFGLLALLAGKAVVRAVIEQAEVLSENNAEGINNWAMGTEKPTAEVEVAEVDQGEFSGLPLHPVIREIRIDDFKLTQLSEPDAKPTVSHLKQLLIETPEKETTVLLSAELNGRPIEISGNLGNIEKILYEASEPVKLSGDIAGNTLDLSGDWGPLFPQTVMDIDIGVKIPPSGSLAELVGLTIEEFEEINITGKIVGDGSTLALNPLVVNLDDSTAKLEIKGSIDDLKKLDGIKITTDANTQSLSTLLKQLGIELATELPPVIEVNADIKGGIKDLALSELVVVARDEGMEVTATTSIGDLLNVEKIDLKVDGTIESLSALSSYAQTELPQTDPIKINATLKGDNMKDLDYALHADTGGANVDISGILASLAVPDQLEADVSIKAASLSNLNRLAQSELPDEGPLDVSAKLKLEKKSLTVSDLKLALNKQAATGKLALILPEKETLPTVINGNLDISFLDLNVLLPEVEDPLEDETAAGDTEPATAALPESTDAEPEAESDRLFSSEPFLYEQLHRYEIDFVVNAREILIRKTDLKDVQVKVNLKDGLFSADPIEGAVGAGKINGVVTLDARSETPKMDVDIGILDVPMPNLGGSLDFDTDLTGSGKSVAELMGGLNGQMLLVMRDGKLEGRLVKKFGSGLLSFSEDKDYTELECAILRVDIKDGMADFNKKLAAQLTEVTWRGGGEINLKTEELDAGITAKPRKGIPISTGSLAGLVHIGGTLKNPKVQLDPKDVAVKYGKYSAHVATGGITYIAEKIKDKIDANKDVCALILDGTVFDEEEQASEK